MAKQAKKTTAPETTAPETVAPIVEVTITSPQDQSEPDVTVAHGPDNALPLGPEVAIDVMDSPVPATENGEDFGLTELDKDYTLGRMVPVGKTLTINEESSSTESRTIYRATAQKGGVLLTQTVMEDHLVTGRKTKMVPGSLYEIKRRGKVVGYTVKR